MLFCYLVFKYICKLIKEVYNFYTNKIKQQSKMCFYPSTTLSKQIHKWLYFENVHTVLLDYLL